MDNAIMGKAANMVWCPNCQKQVMAQRVVSHRQVFIKHNIAGTETVTEIICNTCHITLWVDREYDWPGKDKKKSARLGGGE